MVMSLFSCIALCHVGIWEWENSVTGLSCLLEMVAFQVGFFFLGFWQVWPLGVPGKVSFCVLEGGLGQGTEW